MQAQTRQPLERVVEKANKLKTSRFVKDLIERGYKITFLDDRTDVTKPDEEALDAFILTLRFFTMRNEATSFRGLTKLLSDSDISRECKEAFEKVRDTLNNYLDSSYGTYEVGSKTFSPTNREIMGTFLYGGLAHANDPKAVIRFEEWRSMPVFVILEMWFITALQTVLRAILILAAISEKELKNQLDE